MNFSIKATIRALVAPKHRISCSGCLWKRILAELDRRGERRHESGVFLLGVQRDGRLSVTDCVFYDELDPTAYDSGICVLSGSAFAKLWAYCRERALTVVADVHTHPGIARQSDTDRQNPMVARAGHIAMIVPRYAVPAVEFAKLGIYEYRGSHEWVHRAGKEQTRFFYVGLWS